MRWAGLSRSWRGWRSAAHIIQPETGVAWHRRRFQLFWIWKVGIALAVQRYHPMSAH
jgi:hypothetical protein